MLVSRRDFSHFQGWQQALDLRYPGSFFSCGIKAVCVWKPATETSLTFQTHKGFVFALPMLCMDLHGMDDRVPQERLVPIWALAHSPLSASAWSIEFTKNTLLQLSSSTSASSQPLWLSHSPAWSSALLLHFHPASPSWHLCACLAHSSGHGTQPSPLTSLKPSVLQSGPLQLWS